MSTNRYTVGTLVRVSTAINSLNPAVPIDPTSVELSLELPTGAVLDLTSTIVHDGIGLYHADYLTTVAGFHQYEWAGTGDAQVTKVGSFFVNQGIQ